MEHEIEWNVEFTNLTDTSNPWTNKKTPRFLHSDSSNEQYMYLLGRHWGKASIFRFQKNNANINWYLQVNNNQNDTTPNSKMTDILDYVQPVGYNSLFVCGFAFDDAENEGTKKYATFMKVTTNGRVEQFYKWGQGLDNQPDNCRSIAFDYNKREIVLLLEVTS